MAVMVFDDAYLTVNTVNLADHVKSATLHYTGDIHETTAMGSSTKTRLGGLLDWSLEVEFYQDFAASKVYATLQPLVATSTAISFGADASNPISATNPRYDGNAILEALPIGGSVGEVMMASVTFHGNGDLTFEVTP